MEVVIIPNNNGYKNESDFVDFFNDMYYSEFDENTQLFLKELFENNIDNDELIQCWRNRMNQKADIFIKYKNRVKSISIKSGKSNSLHSESVQDFKMYLEKLNIPYKSIDYYMSYHYGYKRSEDNKKDFSKQLNAEEYKELYQDELDDFNKCINKTRIIVDMIDRFIVRGKNSDYDIDALISGTPNDYVWIMKHDLYDLILSKRSLEFTSPHIACLTIGPKKRCIYGDKNIKDRYLIAVRWNFIKEDILYFQKNKL